MKEIIKDGIKNGFKVCLDLAKIMIPIIFIFTFLKHTFIFEKIASSLSPLMNLLGLPGSATFPLILGFFFNLYAAIAAIVSLQLTTKQLTIMAMMLLTAHTLILEGFVLKKLKVKYISLIIFRIVMAFIIGFFVNIVMT
jgi:hypothetical protein